MSNLTNKFDVIRGWPQGTAVDEYYAVASGVTLVEGQLAIVDSTATASNAAATLKNITAVPAEAAAAAPLALRMVIQGNDQSDAAFAKKVVALRGTFTVVTDKYTASAYTPGQLVTVSVAGGSVGYITPRTVANEQVVGEVESYDSANGKLTVAVTI